MGLFEYLPYSNKHGLNLDWCIKTVRDCQEKVDEYGHRLDEFEATLGELQGDYADLTEEVAAARGDISLINTALEGIREDIRQNTGDISGLKTRMTNVEGSVTSMSGTITTLGTTINRVERESISRDDNLANRISILEDATIQPISLYSSDSNRIAGGDDLRNLPTWTEPESGLTFPWKWNGHNASCTVTYDPATGFYLASGYFSEINYLAEDLALFQGYGSLSDTMTVTVAISDVTTDPGNDLYTTHIDTESLTLINTNWVYTEDGKLRVCLDPAGWLAVRFYDAEYWATHRLVAIKLEVGDESSGLQISSRDKIIMDYAKHLSDDANASPTHVTGTFECQSLFPTYEGQTTEDGLIVGVDAYIKGKWMYGNITLTSPYEDQPISISGGTETLDISSLSIPAVQLPGYKGEATNILTREQYKIFLGNTSSACTSLSVSVYWAGTITPISTGQFATIPFITMLA